MRSSQGGIPLTCIISTMWKLREMQILTRSAESEKNLGFFFVCFDASTGI
jgi:hypothetical protein